MVAKRKSLSKKAKAKKPTKKTTIKRARLPKKVSKPAEPEIQPGSLAETAMLIKLTVSCWGANRNDHAVAQEVATTHQSDATMGRFNKKLLKSKHRERYLKVARETKRVHRLMTLPWDEGVGLLPASLYFKFTEEISKKRREADEHINAFVDEYTEQWNNGMSLYKEQLGSLFNEADYPEPSRVRNKFGIRIRTFNINDPNDFRVKLSDDAREAIKQQIFEDYQQELAEALKVPFFRLHRVLTKVHDRLADEDSVFRDSLIDNVREMMDLLPSLNVTGNKELDALLKKTNKEIASITDMKALRKDPEYRQQVAKSASDILNKMKGFIS